MRTHKGVCQLSCIPRVICVLGCINTKDMPCDDASLSPHPDPAKSTACHPLDLGKDQG